MESKAMKEYAIVTFKSINHALAFEEKAKSIGLTGRLIPVPRALSVSCGMCWREPIAGKQPLEALLQDVEYSVYVPNFEGLY